MKTSSNKLYTFLLTTSIFATLGLASNLAQSETSLLLNKPEDMTSAELTAAALKKDLHALKELGRRYQKGIGVEQNDKMALSFFQKAALAHEDAESYFRLGELSPEEDSARYTIQAANLGYAQAQATIGIALLESGEPEHTELGLGYLGKAVEQEFPLGHALMGKVYAHGLGVDVDHEKALALFKKGAAKGSTTADYELGKVYLSALYGENKDEKKALSHLKKAARNPDRTHAQIILGGMYVRGQGMAKSDLTEGYAWLKTGYEKEDNVKIKMNTKQILSILDENFPLSQKLSALSRYSALVEELNSSSYEP